MFENIEAILNLTLLFLLVVTALFAVMSRNLLNSTFMLGVFSLVMAAEYLVLGAPDVAITEAAVGAGVSTLLFLLALFRVGDEQKLYKGVACGAFFVALAVFGALAYTTLEMPVYGSIETPSYNYLAPHFINNSQEQIGIPNAVTSILASYRGYDTLGEVTVVFTAAVAVILLMANFNKGKKGE